MVIASYNEGEHLRCTVHSLRAGLPPWWWVLLLAVVIAAAVWYFTRKRTNL